jgi:hypothetical protein
MGHALEKTHRLLKPGGVLMENHFTGEATLLEIHEKGQLKYAEPLQSANVYELFKQAKAALDRAVKDNLFLPVAERVFDYLVYADSLGALRDWLAEMPSHLIIDDRLARKVIARVPGPDNAARVVLRYPVRIGRLRRVD